ncbi:hypothetical protein [Phytohabitans kaempferiae]|uniref:Uncharacterized protein n=1 Tax=Phytohabitans kaempferiae TaxID=1620943 RepID=A0ABV6LYT8_9ACTN
MDGAGAKAVGRAFPGPVELAAWLAVTVPAPLVFFQATHRWEEDQPLSTALYWALAPLPVLAATAAARLSSPRSTAGARPATPAAARPRSTAVGRFAAIAAGTAVAAVFLAASTVWYRWVVPLDGEASWPRFWWTGAALAVAGAVAGHVIAPRRWPGGRAWVRPGLVLGVVVALLGAVLATTTVRLGAEDSTVRFDEGGAGGVGPAGVPEGMPGQMVLPKAGRYALLAMGSAPRRPDCRYSVPGVAERRAEPVSIPPGNYGGDYASYAWVATITVPEPGRYALDCQDAPPEASYLVGDVPEIRGAVGALIHWPVAVVWLLGAVPGLLILLAALRRRGGQNT